MPLRLPYVLRPWPSLRHVESCLEASSETVACTATPGFIVSGVTPRYRSPREYCSLSVPTRCRPPGPERHCPACLWHIELDIPIHDGLGPTLRATLHPSLPLYPTEEQICGSKYPVVRWIRRGRECEVMQDQDEGAVACLLKGSHVCVH